MGGVVPSRTPRSLGGLPELRRPRRFLSVPPGSDRRPWVWTAIDTSTDPLDPRLPPRPMVARTSSSRPRRSRHRARHLQVRHNWTNRPVYKARAASPPPRPAMGSGSRPITNLFPLAAIGSSDADLLDKTPTVHHRAPPTTPALLDSMTLPLRPRARLLQGRHVRSDPAPRPGDSRTAPRLTTAHSVRPPGPAAGSSARGCSARGTSGATDPGSLK
jgi:hypothetical protein